MNKIIIGAGIVTVSAAVVGGAALLGGGAETVSPEFVAEMDEMRVEFAETDAFGQGIMCSFFDEMGGAQGVAEAAAAEGEPMPTVAEVAYFDDTMAELCATVEVAEVAEVEVAEVEAEAETAEVEVIVPEGMAKVFATEDDRYQATMSGFYTLPVEVQDATLALRDGMTNYDDFYAAIYDAAAAQLGEGGDLEVNVGAYAWQLWTM
jgi:hypothetical protein